MREAYSDEAVRSEFQYRVHKRKLLSPDWAVLGAGVGVVFEVKKTMLHPQARTYGRLEDVRSDLQRTLQKAVVQLGEFRRNMRYVKNFPEKQNVEFVVVSWDDVWWGNSVLMQFVSNLPEGLHVHVISVRELEELLARCVSPDELYRALWSKRLAGGEDAAMDMRDWLARLPQVSERRPLPSLEQVHLEFFKRWQLVRDIAV